MLQRHETAVARFARGLLRDRGLWADDAQSEPAAAHIGRGFCHLAAGPACGLGVGGCCPASCSRPTELGLAYGCFGRSAARRSGATRRPVAAVSG